MVSNLDNLVNSYRATDALLRLHRDLFEIEDILLKSAVTQNELAKRRNIGTAGLITGGIFVLTPTLVTLFDFTWGSAPAWGIYAVALALLGLQIWLVCSRSDAERDLESVVGQRTSVFDLEDRLDFILERISAATNRYWMIDTILKELYAIDDKDDETHEKIKRWESIQEDLKKEVQDIVNKSQELVKSRRRENADHETLLDWSAALPGIMIPGSDAESRHQ